jgi:hypothetical protein
MTAPGKLNKWEIPMTARSQGSVDMCRRFAVQHIGYWRDAKRKGLRKTAADNRKAALWWLSQAKGLVQ